jgi:hypothetical protein
MDGDGYRGKDTRPHTAMPGFPGLYGIFLNRLHAVQRISKIFSCISKGELGYIAFLVHSSQQCIYASKI